MNILSFDIEEWYLEKILHGGRAFRYQIYGEAIAKVLDGISAEFWLKMQKEYNIAKNRKTKGVSGSVSGYSQSGTPAVARALAEPESSYGNKCQVLLSVPLSDKALLEQLAGRMDWKIL